MKVVPFKKIIVAIILIPILFVSVNADDDFKYQVKPSYNVTKLNGTIQIDGRLDDSGWSNLSRAAGFVETYPDNGVKANAETEVMLTYDESNLYIAFICYDPDPASIRASLINRDRIWNDDYMGMLFDTYGDGAWAYELFSNPIGIQGDGRQMTSADKDINFDLIFYSEGIVTDSGYQIEMAVPFSSLRVPDKPVQEWKATFWRTRPRESRTTSSWAYMDENDNCFICQYGTLTGIENIQPSKSIEILPSVIAFQSGEIDDYDNPDTTFNNNDPDGELSLGLKYSLSTSTTLEATINPDFSQVETDIAQIDVNQTFALYYPEKRPFFQEGGDLFETWINVVHTRSINDPIFATKIIRRTGSGDFAYMGAIDENTPVIIPLQERSEFAALERSYSNILRYKQAFKGSSSLGALVSDRRLKDGGFNTVFGIDGNYKISKNYRFEAQLLGSNTEEPDLPGFPEEPEQIYFNSGDHTVAFDGEKFWGRAAYISLERGGRHFNFDLDYGETSPTFRADNGFIARNDNREASLWSQYSFYPGHRMIDKLDTGLRLGRVWNSSGKIKDGWIMPSIEIGLKKQTWIEFSYVYTSETFHDLEFYGMQRIISHLSSDFSEAVQVGINLTVGEQIARREDPPVLGNAIDWSIWLDYKPVSQMTITNIYNYSSLENKETDVKIYDGFIWITRVNYQFTRELNLRLFTQYNDFDNSIDIDPLLSYELNPFSIFYIGSTLDYMELGDENTIPDWEPNRTLASRQFLLKFQYLFRL